MDRLAIMTSMRGTMPKLSCRRRDRALKGRTALMMFSLLLALAFAGGCKVNDKDIDTWKGTVKGPGKMVAVMLADKYEIPLRTHAALALVEMERQDVDGVAELQRAIQKLDPETRNAILDGLAPELIKLMNTSPADAKESEGPSTAQIRAKDAAFLLIPTSSEQTRKELTDAVVGWYVTDFNGRNLSGNFSAEQVVRALGAPAAQKLVEALNEKLPQQALIKLAELIGQLGRTETKQEAGDKLVAIEAAMRSEAFTKWLSDQIREQLKAAGSKVDESRVAKVAALNQAKFIEDGAIPAMKYLAGEPKVAERLIQVAEDKSADATRRASALMALEGKAKESQLDRMLALALDSNNPVAVRDYAFDRVGDIGSKKAIPALWPLLESTQEQRLRWRAGELLLALGGPEVVPEFFAKLPSAAGVAYEPEELEGYATRMGQMSPLPNDQLHSRMSSPRWWEKVIALRYFERKGSLADVPAMERLKNDKTAVAGQHWGKDMTVGKVAEQAIAGLRERLKQASATKGSAS